MKKLDTTHDEEENFGECSLNSKFRAFTSLILNNYSAANC
jgi:hypothetical protein